MSARFRCLAIETSTRNGSVALGGGEHVLQRQLTDVEGSSRLIYREIAALFTEANIDAGDLHCVAFGCGPGSFTGVRLAASVAQALAYARDLPVCRVSSLAAIAVAITDTAGDTPVASCLDARMGEAYLGIYAGAASGLRKPLYEDRLVDPASFLLPQNSGGVVAAGPGWDAWPDMLERNREQIAAMVADAWPTAASVLTIAEGQFGAGDYVQAVDALPNYVRENVAQRRV